VAPQAHVRSIHSDVADTMGIAADFCALEALKKAAGYSQASEVPVRLAQSNGLLRFEVEDDGREAFRPWPERPQIFPMAPAGGRPEQRGYRDVAESGRNGAPWPGTINERPS